MIRRPPRATRTDPLFPYTTLFRSPGEQVTLVRKKQRALDFEPIGGEPLEADRRIGAVGAGPKILPDTRLRVEIGPDRPAVERLSLGALDAFAEQDRKSTRLNSSH